MLPSLSMLFAVIAAVVLIGVAWRVASRQTSLPCPAALGWVLESPFYAWMTGTEKTLGRIAAQPGQRILEIGPGPGRLLMPLAKRVLPGGEAVGVDIQVGMVERLARRAKAAGVTNLQAIHGDATQPLFPEATFDVVVLATTLGEIPNQKGAVAEAYRVLKTGGRLSVTEMLPDPHYQSQTTVRRLAEDQGFRLIGIEGGRGLFTATFAKPPGR
jgi:ubiquinone/menaquinone biosynthesis C-methylase UbiE